LKITDIQVDGFGVWKGLTVESISDEITVFCGENEAGKTTLMQFIRSMMFGFDSERLDKYTPPVYGGLSGGSIDITSPTGAYEVQRHVDPNRHSDPIGDLAVTDNHDGSVHGRAHLSSLLSDIDESIFNNVFAIGLREIQELGALNSTAAAEQLYKLTSGLDRVSLIDVMKDLRLRRDKIWSSSKKQDSRLEELSDKRQKLLREIDELKQRSKRWSRMAAETTDLNHQIQDIEKTLATKEREARLVEIAMQVSDRWQSRKMLREQIRAFGKLPDPRDISIPQLDEFNTKITQVKERIEQIKGQRRGIKKEALSLPINRNLWAQKSRIEAITEHLPWVESLQRQSERLQNEIDTLENSLVGEVDGLGNQLKIRAKDVKDLGDRGFATLETSGKKLQDEKDRLKKSKQELDKVEFDLGQHQERLGNSLAEKGTSDSLEDTGRYVNRLRRRIELEEKIEKLNQNRHDLERDIDDIVNEQVLPVGKLSIIGFVFIIGIVFLGFGLLDTIFGGNWLSDTGKRVGILFIFMGAIAGFISMSLKYHWERIAKDELDDFRHQMDIIRQQLKRCKQERDEIERQLPASVTQWDLELKDAENRLMLLEDLVPLENRVQATRSVSEDLRRQIASQERDVAQADELWRSSLRTVGLPEVLEPHQLKEIIQRSDRISGFNYRLDQFRTEKLERDKELATLNKRIDLMLHESGLQFTNDNLVDRLNQITLAINEQRSLVNTRKELANRYKSLRTRLNKAKRELDKLLGARQRLLAVVGAESEEAYRLFETKHAERKKLVEKTDNLSEQILAALGKHFNEEHLKELLDCYGTSGLEKHWESIHAKIEEIKALQSRLHQQRGEFIQEVKTLGEDSRLDVANLELNAVEAEIQKLQKDWQVLAASTQMLEMIRESYESKRQPETLKEASGYLERLTEGKYSRIWTRLVGEELLVDNGEDETIPVEKLSRGTREAVFLSLRMALVGAYARRGATIPMVLDDVLVNFDGHRAHSAAALLSDFAKNGYQIMMFTCHEHMRDLFYDLGSDVRILPRHKDVVESQAIPVRYERNGYVQPALQIQPEPELESIPEPLLEDEPIEYIRPSLTLETDEYDPELEYELSAVMSDQQTEQKLRSELVYISPNFVNPIDISGNEDIWSENETPATPRRTG
jgi:uncharacterized protein YhaN